MRLQTKHERTEQKMKYFVANWDTEEIIKVFDSFEDRQNWIERNVKIDHTGGYLEDGTKIEIYEY